jgi:hypothetical protein
VIRAEAKAREARIVLAVGVALMVAAALLELVQ